MAQVELRLFDEELKGSPRAGLRDLCAVVMRSVNWVHYKKGEDELDITLVVPELSVDLCHSDAAFELEITEGSSNWPKDLTATSGRSDMWSVVGQLEHRAKLISYMITRDSELARAPHNIFEVTGVGTGWFQRRSGFEDRPGLTNDAAAFLLLKDDLIVTGKDR
ncbi:MAG: hypothetical protein AAF413_02250 [Patescibacteria group bacterium]